MYSYPSIDLGNIEIQDWEKLIDFVEKAGKPFVSFGDSIGVMTKRRDWRFTICKLYRKGIWEITLNAIRNPYKKIEQLRAIKKKEWDWAEKQARNFIDMFKRGELQ